MTTTRVRENLVTLNQVLALPASEPSGASKSGSVAIYLDVLNIDVLWKRVQESGTPEVDPLNGEMGRRRFRCLDPKGISWK
jgi:uncharacterized glyoxalase superfamily protein PhnB